MLSPRHCTVMADAADSRALYTTSRRCLLLIVQRLLPRGSQVWMLALSATLLLALSSHLAQAAEELVSFDNPQHAERYYALLKEYRCLKCQNQNLFDSNASLAVDLRREIRELVLADKDKATIDEFLVSRYGEFVLFRPRFNKMTLLLWVGPFALLLIGLIGVWLIIRHRSADREKLIASTDSSGKALEESAERLARARQLLDD